MYDGAQIWRGVSPCVIGRELARKLVTHLNSIKTVNRVIVTSLKMHRPESL